MKVEQLAKGGVVIILTQEELLQIGEEMVGTPGLVLKPSTPYEKLVVQVVKASDNQMGGK
jgi:hypothetical protein